MASFVIWRVEISNSASRMLVDPLKQKLYQIVGLFKNLAPYLNKKPNTS
jgi:hypothetical protein